MLLLIYFDLKLLYITLSTAWRTFIMNLDLFVTFCLDKIMDGCAAGIQSEVKIKLIQ